MLSSNVHHYSLPSTQRGFTLIEVITVVFMLGVLCALGVPSILESYAQKKLGHSLDQLQTSLELSQADAIKQGKKCQVYVPDGDRIVAKCNTGLSGNITSNSIPNIPDGLAVIPLDSGITMSSNLSSTSKKITYSFRGSTDKNATIILSSTDTSLQKCLVVSNGIGLIRTGNISSGSCVNNEF
jgi:prepilin-type N-terminal cleavage/methylation domain-containing protein